MPHDTPPHLASQAHALRAQALRCPSLRSRIMTHGMRQFPSMPLPPRNPDSLVITSVRDHITARVHARARAYLFQAPPPRPASAERPPTSVIPVSYSRTAARPDNRRSCHEQFAVVVFF